MGLLAELSVLKEFEKREGEHKFNCLRLEKLEVDHRYVEACNRVTYRRVLLGAREADTLKKVACLWE